MNKYIELCKFYRKIKQFGNIAGIIHWDTATMMPLGAAKYRAEDMATLHSSIHQMLSSNQLGDIITSINEASLDEWQKANVREIKLARKNALAVETHLVELATKATTECEMIWRKARKNNDFKMLSPYLQKVISLTRDIAKSKAEYFNSTPYDALLDTYDPGRKTADIEKVCNDFRKFLPNFIKKVVDKQKSRKIKSFNSKQFSEKDQKELGLYCMKKVGFDFSRGRLDVSTHPFCGGNARDVRLTTRYDQDNFLSGLMGIMHETGHALYQQNLPEEYTDQAVGDYRSMSIHESQSLLAEIHIGRSRDFFEFIQPKIVETFRISGKEYGVENLYNMANKVQPSLIRVDADEVTYPAHIILRFDLEKEIISGNLQTKDLPGAWAEGMKKLLGIEPDKDSNGCMQDVHWPSGIFGYFPTYLLGLILSAQFFAKIKEKNPSIDNDIKSGNFYKVIDWLKKSVHSKGCLYSVSDLIINATGRDIDAACYKKYLEHKYY
jgi:carboxypeptidase Taq